MLLGAIADDLTGASDLALTLVRNGLRTVQLVGVPEDGLDLLDADAYVVALKSRTIPAAEAVEQSMLAARRLLDAGARQLFFKYCSTFDSTDEGNIGPVTEALLRMTGESLTVACPAFPINGRTVYQGHLFVGDQLLSDSPMRDHPLTPMRDSNLIRVLQRQTKLQVGLIPHATVAKGPQVVAQALEGRRGIVIVDAICDADLHTIGRASANLKLITGGSGVALGLPENFRRAGLASEGAAPARFVTSAGRTVILSGSCSSQTRRQIEHLKQAGVSSFQVDPLALAQGAVTLETVLNYIGTVPSGSVPAVYSTADPDAVRRAQDQLGRDRATTLVESLLGNLARELIGRKFTHFIVAGGETSGAVVASLGIKALAIGPEIDAGVPWVFTRDREPFLTLALKSGNFGADDFFTKACRQLQ